MAPNGSVSLLLGLLLVAAGSGMGAEAGTQSKDSFDEELFMKELPDGKVYAHFQFTTQWNMSLDAQDACKLPPV